MIKRSLTVGAITLLLCGCGFQLRGTGDSQFALKELDVQARDSYGGTLKDVRAMLQDNGVNVHGTAPYHLILGDERDDSLPVSYTAGVRAVEIKVVKSLNYQVRGSASRPLLSDSVSVQRFFTQDSSNPMGNVNETSNLIAEMHRDLLQQLFLRLHSLTPEQLDTLEAEAEAKQKAEKEALERSRAESVSPLQSPNEPAPEQ